MIALRLAISELRRISAGSLPKLALVAMVVIPSLYAGLYVYANKDPYGSLGRVPAALVVQDRGATVTNPINRESQRVHYGDKVADRLLDGDSGFGWEETSLEQAREGVDSGLYDAALVIGPDFSEQLSSVERFRPQQASLDLLTNDATNYLATTIAKTIADDVRDEIGRDVGTKAANLVLRGLHVVQRDLEKAGRGAKRLASGSARLARGTVRLDNGVERLASGAKRAASGVQRLASGSNRLVSGSVRLASGAGTLSKGLTTLQQKTAVLPADTRKLASGAAQVAKGNAEIAEVGRAAAGIAQAAVSDINAARNNLLAALDQLVQQGDLTRQQANRLAAIIGVVPARAQQILTTIKGASAKLNKLGSGSAQLAAGAAKLARSAPQLTSGIARASSGGAKLASGAGTLSKGTRTLAAGTRKLNSGAAKLASGTKRLSSGTDRLVSGTKRLKAGSAKLSRGLKKGANRLPDLDRSTSHATATTIADPISIDEKTAGRAGSYGAGLAPFFMALAAWIGAYVLFLLVRPLSKRALAANGPPLRTALGGMLPPAIVGLAQMLVMIVVVRLALDLDPANELATVAVMALASAAFVAIIQALNAWLGAVGEFLGLVLMLVQLVTAGGTFPWETIPQPLRALHWFLPMSYTVNALRQSLYGGDNWLLARDLAILAAVAITGLVATAIAARRQRVWTAKRLQPELVL